MKSICLPAHLTAFYLVEGPPFTDRTYVYITFTLCLGKASVLFLWSLRLLSLVDISLAAEEAGKGAWLPLDLASAAYSSAPNRGLAPQKRERGELAASLCFAYFDCLKDGKGQMLLFLVISIYVYLTFSMNDLFYIDKKISFVARHVMIFPAAFALSASSPPGSRFLASERELII